MQLRRIVLVSGVIAVAFLAGVAVGAQPHMEAALHALEAAKTELAIAEHDKGGWRERALKHVEEAMKETRKGMAYAAK